MKIRIKSHSIRFRVDDEDLAQFHTEGFLSMHTHIPVLGDDPVVFSSRIARARDDEPSRLSAEPFGFTFILSAEDSHQLMTSDEGVYIRRDWTNPEGREIRFVAYIEKDKKRKHPPKRDKE